MGRIVSSPQISLLFAICTKECQGTNGVQVKFIVPQTSIFHCSSLKTKDIYINFCTSTLRHCVLYAFTLLHFILC